MHLVHRVLETLGPLGRLHAQMRGVVVGADRPARAAKHEAALRLRLQNPRVGEGAPARLDLGQPVRVAADGDAVLIDPEPRRLVLHARHFQRLAPALEPRPERRPVARVIQQRTAAARRVVKPARRLFLRRRHRLHLVRAMKKRPAISPVVMKLHDLADQPLVQQPLRGDVTGEPPDRPVDRQQLPRRALRRDHRIRVRERRGERFLHHDIHAVLRHPLRPQRMLARRRAEDHEIRLRLFQTRPVVRENAFRRDGKILHRRRHALRFFVADSHQFRIGMLACFPQQIPHVHVVEIDACDAKFFAHRDARDFARSAKRDERKNRRQCYSSAHASPARSTRCGCASRSHSGMNSARGSAVLKANIS